MVNKFPATVCNRFQHRCSVFQSFRLSDNQYKLSLFWYTRLKKPWNRKRHQLGWWTWIIIFHWSLNKNFQYIYITHLDMSNMLVARRYGDETISSENVANEHSIRRIKLNLSNRWRALTAMRILINLVEMCSYIVYPSLWPSGIGSHLGWNRLWVRFLAKSDIYPMFIHGSFRGSLGTYYGLTQKLCWKKDGVSWKTLHPRCVWTTTSFKYSDWLATR